jgi:hypothetical protein
MDRPPILPLNVITATTIRARVAYCLAVANRAFQVVKPTDLDYALGADALKKCWEWLEGHQYDAWDIYELECRFDAEGSPIGVGMTAIDVEDPVKKPAWECLSATLAYVSWCLFKDPKWTEDDIPEGMSEVNDDFIDRHIVGQAQRTNNVEGSDFDPLKQYFLETYPLTEPDEIGPPITREEVMAHLPH